MERDAAIGVQLSGGETIAADWVISAADGHATIDDLLGGEHTGKVTDEIYSTLRTFLLSAGLPWRGAGPFTAGRYVTQLLDAALVVDLAQASAGLVPLLSSRRRSSRRHPEKERGRYPPGHRGDRRVDARHRHSLHGQLERGYGGLAVDAQYWLQTVTE